MKSTANTSAASRAIENFTMKGQQFRRISVLLVVALFCYQHATSASAEQRIVNVGDSMARNNNYPREAVSFGRPTEVSPLSKSSMQQRQITGTDHQASNEQIANRVGPIARYTWRYNIRDIDQDNSNDNIYARLGSTNGDQLELAKIGELLEALSMSLSPPSPPPISQSPASEQVHRSGRTYLFGSATGTAAPPSGLIGGDHQQVAVVNSQEPAFIQSAASYNRYMAQQQQQPQPLLPQTTNRRLMAAVFNNRQREREREPLIIEPRLQMGSGLVSNGPSILYPPSTRTMYNGPIAPMAGRTPNNARRSHHTSDTAEVAIHTPLHSRSVSDYEWKRVENSRWNNLRGMWGKRSVPSSEGADRDDTTSYSSGNPYAGDESQLTQRLASDQNQVSRQQRKRSPALQSQSSLVSDNSTDKQQQQSAATLQQVGNLM